MKVVQNNLNRNLLVVEDERVIGDICQRVLTKEGFNVTLARDGRKAIQLLAEIRFDLCLLDVRTPGIDGIELYKYICQTYPDLSFKVIFMTGDAMAKSIPEFANQAGCQLLEKPFTTDQLISAIKNHSKVTA